METQLKTLTRIEPYQFSAQSDLAESLKAAVEGEVCQEALRTTLAAGQKAATLLVFSYTQCASGVSAQSGLSPFTKLKVQFWT